MSVYMKFKIDENLPTEAALLMKENGHDALTIMEQNLSGSSDSNIAEICRKEKRVLITLDTDFADIQMYPPNN